MASSQRGHLNPTERWMQERTAQVLQGAGRVYNRGVQAYADAVRTGEKIQARTTAEVKALGREAIRRVEAAKAAAQTKSAPARPPAPTTSYPKAAPPKPGGVRPAAGGVPQPRARGGAEEQLRAAISGAADEFTFGLADRTLAAGEALMEGGVRNFGQNYAANMEEKRAQDAYDSENYGTARNTGRVVGLGAGLLATGPAGAVLKAGLKATPTGARLVSSVAKVPKLKGGVDPRGLAALSAAGGAGGGAVGQVAADVVTGDLGSVGDYAGAIAGGAFGGLATTRRGAVQGGAMAGAATSALQDVLNGREVSMGDAIGAAHLSAVAGGLAEGAGTHLMAGASNRLKGQVGEALSYGKTLARGMPPPPLTRVRVPVKGGYAIPDQILANGQFVEAKMGPGADLSGRQRQLRRMDPDRFILDAWQFRDVGRALSAGATPVGQFPGDDGAVRR